MTFLQARKTTTKLMELYYEGELDATRLIQNLVNWMSEDEVKQFMEANYPEMVDGDFEEDDDEE